MNRRALRATLVAGAVLVASCGGGDDDDVAGPLVADIAPAVEALEAELDGAQDYFEINVDRAKVTLWVASDDASQATPYVFADGELAQASDPRDASGETFTAAEGLTFDADEVLDEVLADFGERVQQFSIVGGEGSVVRFGVIVQSQAGGQLDVGLAGDGRVLEAAPVT